MLTLLTEMRGGLSEAWDDGSEGSDEDEEFTSIAKK